MPELPEIESTLRSIYPYVKGQRIREIIVYKPKLRWTVSKNMSNSLSGEVFISIERRAKYLLFHTKIGTLVNHLGMSGSLQLLSKGSKAAKHTCVDINLESGLLLRYTDVRRFGSMLLIQNPFEHKLLKNIGPEPLSDFLSGEYLFKVSRKRSIAIKAFLMDSKVVAGLGNIYTTEALFAAGIDPRNPAQDIPLSLYLKLVIKIKGILSEAILLGGTTLRNFSDGNGKPGSFQKRILIYGRSYKPCFLCKSVLYEVKINQRSSVFCPKCQT